MYRYILITLTIAMYAMLGRQGIGQEKPKATPAGFIKRFDKDNDGALGKAELPAPLQAGFDRFDANGDGALGEKEVARMLTLLRQRAAANNPKFIDAIFEKLDKNSDGVLNKTETEGSKLAEYFDRLDANKDGSLDRKELNRLRPAPRSNPNAASRYVDQILQKYDKDKDGVINKAEAKGSKLAELFDRRDANKDGKLDRKELVGLRPAPQPNSSAAAQYVDQVLQRFDKNKDGVIKKAEVEGSKLAEFFDRLDANKDGSLDKTELARLRRPNPTPTAAFVDRVLQRFDKNKDGVVSKEEAQGNRLGEYFARLDRNKDNKLDKQELARLRPANSNPFVTQLIQRMDANKNGKLEKKEVQGRLAQYFDRLDANKDGALDRTELARVRPAGGQQPGARPQQPPEFDAFDKDADGRLTAEELKGTPLAERFAAMDADKDGKIKPKEFEKFFQMQSNQ